MIDFESTFKKFVVAWFVWVAFVIMGITGIIVIVIHFVRKLW